MGNGGFDNFEMSVWALNALDMKFGQMIFGFRLDVLMPAFPHFL